MADMLERIGKILNQADRAETDGEREQFLRMADALMHKHKIDEAMARSTIDQGGPKLANRAPVKYDLTFVPKWDEFLGTFQDVVYHLARLTGVRLVYETSPILAVFGYDDDVQYFRMLWTSAHLAFSGKINPKWSGDMTEGENIKMMAEAGYSWKEIWEKGRVAGALSQVKMPPADNGKMKRLATAAYTAAGEKRQPVTQSRARYRQSYAEGFSTTIGTRCTSLTYEREQRERELSTGVAMVLSSDVDAIEALIRATYPYGLSKGSRSGGGVRGNLDPAAARHGASAGRSVDLTGSGNALGAQKRTAIG